MLPAQASPLVILVVALALGLSSACEDEPRGSTVRPAAQQLDVGVAALREAEDTQQLDGFAAIAAELPPPIDGLSLETTGRPDDGTGILIARVENLRFTPSILARNGRKLSARRALKNRDVALVVGSGFVSELQSAAPLGLLSVDGDVLSDLSIHGYTRILGTRGELLEVLGRSTYTADSLTSALQVGPGIVEDGRLDISERERALTPYIRTFVALCGDTTVAGVTSAPRHLYDLGRQFLQFAAEASLQCQEMVNLSGDREAVLAVRRDGNSYVYVGDPNSAKAALIGFRPKPTTETAPDAARFP